MKIAILIGVFTIILGLLIYSKTKKFRVVREKVLIHSSEFQKLLRIGFKTRTIGNKIIYIGEHNRFSFAVFIDSDDLMANSNFSLVFSVAYAKFDDEKFKRLNKEYYNRIKSLLMNTENLFFYKDFAQFRYSNNVLRVPKNKIISKLKLITEILEREELEPRVMTDLRTFISRGYE